MSKHARHCFGEKPEVYEVTGNSIASVLKKASKAVEKLDEDASWVNLTLSCAPDMFEDDYTLTLYVH
jgi:hypothetical protein